MRKTETSAPPVLGLYVTAETIDAVLLRERAGKVEIVDRFRRQRIEKGELTEVGELTSALPGLHDSDDSDYVLEIGDGKAEVDLPVDVGSGDLGNGDGAPGAPRASSFVKQLRDLLEECRAHGTAEPALAFCVGSPSVSYTELQLAEAELAKATSGNGRKAPKQDETATASGRIALPDRKRLLGQLETQQGPLQGRRAGFIPMTPVGSLSRAMAVVTDPAEPVAATLAQLRGQPESHLPEDFRLDSEAAVFAAVVPELVKPRRNEVTVVVRVGVTDTLVMFFEGPELSHLERLRSISAYDSADTVCSRVILQQDERRIGHVNSVIVTTTGKWEPLAAAFKEFYPDAAIEPLHEVLMAAAARVTIEDEVLQRAPAATAAAAALAHLNGWNGGEATDLLPQQLHKKQRSFRVAWYTVLAVLVLIVVSVFAVLQYQTKAAEVEAVQQEMIQNPPPTPVADPNLLQARVDELEQTYRTYTRALHVLDSLLVGSDRWVSTMERLSNATAATPRTWIDSVEPRSGTSIRITGRSLARLSIVELARRLDGAIQQLTYQDVGQQRVYYFEMLMPAPLELPRAAHYLRNVEADAQPQGAVEVHPARHDH